LLEERSSVFAVAALLLGKHARVGLRGLDQRQALAAADLEINRLVDLGAERAPSLAVMGNATADLCQADRFLELGPLRSRILGERRAGAAGHAGCQGRRQELAGERVGHFGHPFWFLVVRFGVLTEN